jgi:hypothetical protein
MLIRDAFLATVTEASDVAPTSVGGTSRWHVELRVEATYRGRAPKTLAFGGFDEGGCGDLLGEALHVGDRIIVAAEDLRPDYQPSDPFRGHMILWRKTDSGWSFYDSALVYGADPAAYPAVARAATTKADILRVILASALPDTATADLVAEASESPRGLISVGAFAVGFAFALYRLRRQQGSNERVASADAD